MNPYEVLGLAREATPEEVRKAYRSLSKKRHPDQGGTPEAWEELQQAYNVLIEPVLRAHYDSTGVIGKVEATNEAFKQITIALTNLLQKASQTAIQAMNKNPEQVDLLGMMISFAQEAEANLNKQVTNLQDGLTRVEKLVGRFTAPEGRPDFMEWVIKNQIHELRVLVKPLEESLTAMTSARVYLQGCKFRQEVPMFISFNTNGSELYRL